MKPDAVLQIFYQNKGRTYVKPQGKFYYYKNQPIYLADMKDSNLMRIYNGYSISKRILDKFLELKLKVLIVYRVRKTQTLLIARCSDFTSHGIVMDYNGHSQYVLPIKNWTAKPMIDLHEPMDLPVVSLEVWAKQDKSEYDNRPQIEEMSLL